MRNWWKRSLSLFLSLVLVLGLMPTGLKAKAAEGVDPSQDLNNANGIIWLTKNEAGDSVSDEFSSMVQTKFLLDDMVREALGITDAKTKVYFKGVDVGNVMDLMRNQEVVESLLDEMKESISNQYLVDFTINNTVQKIAFRNLKAAEIVVGEDNKIYIDHKGTPASADVLEQLISDALNSANVSVTHTGTVSATGIKTTGTKARYEGSDLAISNKQTYADLVAKWPTISSGLAERKAGTVTVTIYAAEYDAKDPDDKFKQTVTADVILRDSDRATVTVKAVAMGPDGEVQDAELAGYEYSYQAYIGDTMKADLKPVLDNYRWNSWKTELPATVTGDATYFAVMEAKTDSNGNGLADQNEVFTVTYLDADGVQIGEPITEKFGAATPEVAKPVAPEGKKYIWKLYNESTGEVYGAWQPKVNGNVIYKAVLLEGPSVTGTLMFRGKSSTPVELFTYLANLETNDGYKVEDPSWETLAQEGYISTGWYTLVPEGSEGAEDLNRDGKAEELPFVMDSDIVYTENGSVELYFEFFTTRFDEYWADGTELSPMYIYKIDVNGVSKEVELGEDKGEVDENLFPECKLGKYQLFGGWEYTLAETEGAIYTYSVEPVIIDIESTVSMDSTVDTMVGQEYTSTYEIVEDGLLRYIWTKAADDYYEAFVEISGMTKVESMLRAIGTEEKYNFLYDANTEITVSPIWKVEGNSKKIAFYVDDIRVDQGSILGGYTPDFEAFSETGKYADPANPEVTLYIGYKPANFKLKDTPDSVQAGLSNYSEKDVYEAIMDTTEKNGIKFAPDYNADEMTVLYLAREKEDIEIDLYMLYELFDVEGLGVLLDGVGSLPKTYTVPVTEKWLNVSAEVSAEKTAQEVTDAFIKKAYEQQKAEKFANIEDFINNFLPDLVEEIDTQAIHKFGNNVNGNSEEVKIAYKGEKYSAEAKVDALPLVDDRTPTYFVVDGNVTTPYGESTGSKVLNNVTLYANGVAITGVEFVTLDGADARDYTNAGTGEYNNVVVAFKGNDTYQPATSDAFKLTVTKVEPTVEVEELIAVLKGTDYYDKAVAKVAPNAPIVQIVAGISADEFKLDSNLALADNKIVIDAWVKLPKTYTELLDGLNLGELNGMVDGVNLPSTTIEVGAYYEKEHLEEVLEEYIADADVAGADQIQQILDIMDRIPEKLLNRLGVNDMNYTLRIRLDALEDQVYPTDSGFYVNYAATLSTFTNKMGGVDKNYGTSDDYGFIVISPMVPVPNRGGVQLYDGEISNAQNVFVYEYNGEKIERDLEVAINGEKKDDKPFYYGLTTRFDATQQVPSTPGVYFAGYNYTTEVYNEDSKENEVRRLGSDSAIIIIKQREVDLNIVGGTYEFDGDNHFAEIIVTDKNGTEVNDAGATIISGTANVNTGSTNVSIDDLYGTVNIDFPDALQNKWDEYCNRIWGQNAQDKFAPSDVISFLEECGDAAESAANKAVEEFKDLAINETVSAALDKINGKLDKVDVSSDNLIDKAERIQHLMQGGKAYYDALIKQLEPLKAYDNNVWITFYDLEDEADKLDYSKTGYYLYLGLTTDPDVTVSGGKALVIIHSADDYIMRDTHVPYDGQPHNIFIDDTTTRGDVTVMVDREENEIKFFLDGDVFKAVNEALTTVLGAGTKISDGGDGYVATAYTKAEKVADAVTAKLVDAIKKKAIDKIKAKYPNGGEALEEALGTLETKVNNLTDKVSAKLQELDKMPADTRIVVYEKSSATDLNGMPVDAGTYEFYGYDYDVSATRGTLVIEPIYVVVDDNDAWKYVNEQDPALTAEVTYYSYEGYAPDAVAEVAITQLPAGVTEAELVSYTVDREDGEAIGFYDITVDASLLDASGNYVLVNVEDGDDFEIRVYGTILKGKGTLSLKGEVYIEYMPVLEGFEGIDLTDKGGLVIWNKPGKPTSSNLIYPENTDDCIVLQNMYWSDKLDAWTVTTNGINAKNYGDLIYMRPFIEINGNYIYGEAIWYSPELYCEEMLNASLEEAPYDLKEVCAALLEYGAAAQTYFGYKTDELVNDGWDFSAYDLAYADNMLDDLVPPVKETTPSVNGTLMRAWDAKATLSLKSAVVLEVVLPNVTAENIVSSELLVWTKDDFAATDNFRNDADTCTFRVPLELGTLMGDDGYVATLRVDDPNARYAGISAKECGDTIYFMAYFETEENGEIKTYRTNMKYYSPDEYVRKQVAEGTKEAEVSMRLAVYSEKAKAYFANPANK
ncbi:MAG: Ig-like domain repeat protein [Lachnospiraceae bacterium]|nr:Ig-like domain repeat protein [Lachnospiraceae bacterium]